MAMNEESNSPTADVPAEVRLGVFVVVAAYNEAVCLDKVVRELSAEVPNVVVVDDGSTDNTYETAKGCAPFVLRHLLNRGQGAALQTGIDYALSRGARYIVTFDADGQHRVEDVWALIDPIYRGECEITLGSRFLGNTVDIPTSRRLMLRLGTLFTRVVSRVKVTDTHNGLRGFSRRAAGHIHITMDRMAHASQLIDQIRRSGLRYQEVPVQIRYTKYSVAKGQTPRAALRILVHYFLGRILR